jgi:hypothetical protein
MISLQNLRAVIQAGGEQQGTCLITLVFHYAAAFKVLPKWQGTSYGSISLEFEDYILSI